MPLSYSFTGNRNIVTPKALITPAAIRIRKLTGLISFIRALSPVKGFFLPVQGESRLKVGFFGVLFVFISASSARMVRAVYMPATVYHILGKG